MLSAKFIFGCLFLSLSISIALAGDRDHVVFESHAQTFKGKMSTFGGPNDHGVSPSEGTPAVLVLFNRFG